MVTTRNSRAAREELESCVHALVRTLASEDRSPKTEPSVAATTPAKSRRVKRRYSRPLTRSMVPSRVEKAYNKAPVDKASRDPEYYKDNPMDGDFITGHERGRNRKYMKLWTRLLRIFGSVAQQLETEGRLNTREIDMDSLPLLVSAVTGGRHGLMQDLATCKEKLGMSDSGDDKWGDERPVEELLEVLEVDVADNTSLVAIDERSEVETREDETSAETAVSGAVTQSGPSTAPIRRIITTRAPAQDLPADNGSLRRLYFD